jgi:D-sedoheptulose 7-phosphate isomerase
MTNYILEQLLQARDVAEALIGSAELHDAINSVAQACTQALASGNKLLFAGNGGSAAQAQHIAAEFVGRFMLDRGGMAAIALTTDTSILTAIANDYGVEKLFSRQIEALGRQGDVFFGISTSGRSHNVIAALGQAKMLGLTTVGLTGVSGFSENSACDYEMRVPSDNTARIQEGHLAIAHVLCGLIEARRYP